MANPSGKGEAGYREETCRDWVGGLVRAMLAIYLVPALLVALIVGGLALAVGAGCRIIKAIGARRPIRSRSDGLGLRPIHQGSHLGIITRQSCAGWPGRETHPRS